MVVVRKSLQGLSRTGARTLGAIVLMVAVLSTGMVAATGGVATASVGTTSSVGLNQTGAASPIYYLALGDSVPVWDGTDSYPNLLLAHFQASLPGLQLVNLAVSGETTDSMRLGGQYAAALSFLGAHQGQVAFITLDIGGNDVLPCGFNLDTKASQCSQLTTMKANLSAMLAGLRAAAPLVPIFGMTYYDPLLGNWLAGGTWATGVLANLQAMDGLNKDLTKLYGTKLTADVAGAFANDDSTTLESSPWGRAPVDVVNACQWLDIICSQGGLEQFGDDPNVTGQLQIAQAFEAVMGAYPPGFSCSAVSGSPSSTIRLSGCTSWRGQLKYATVDGSFLTSGSSTLRWSPTGQTTDIDASITSPGQGTCGTNFIELDLSGTVSGGTTISPGAGDPVSIMLCQSTKSLHVRLLAGTVASL